MQFDANSIQIKKAHKVKAFMLHPDKDHDDAAAANEAFQSLGEAYRILSDPDEKGKYDRARLSCTTYGPIGGRARWEPNTAPKPEAPFADEVTKARLADRIEKRTWALKDALKGEDVRLTPATMMREKALHQLMEEDPN